MWVTNLGPTKSEWRTQARAYQGKCTYEEIPMCLGEAPMTLQERQGILRKLTTRELCYKLLWCNQWARIWGLVLIGGSHKYGVSARLFTKCACANIGRTLHGLLAHWTICIAHESMNMHPGDPRLTLIDRALIPESGIRAHFWLSGSMWRISP